jgi:hypothetical protein
MANFEGQQVDTLPVQLYGWNYDTNLPVKVKVDSYGQIETTNG